MWGRVIGMYIILVGVIGGTGYAMFPWFTLAAVGWLAGFSAVATGFALFILKITGRLGTGGGGGGSASATYQSKGARRDDR